MIRSIPDLVIIYALHYRKELLSTILLAAILGSILFVGVQKPLTQIVSTVGVLLLSTDYRALKLVYQPLYEWIERPTTKLWPEKAIEFALELVKVNYHAKKYESAGNPEMPVVSSKGRKLGVNSSDCHELLTEGMIFQIYFEEIIVHDGQELPAPRRLGLARVTEVTETVSWLRVTEWNHEHPSQRRAILRGRLDGLNPYVKAKMSQEVLNSDESELEDAYKSVRNIHHNRERMKT